MKKEVIKEAIRLLVIALENLDDMDIIFNERNLCLFNQTQEILAEVIEDLGSFMDEIKEAS